MPEAKRKHGQARPSYGPGVQGTGVFGNPRIPSHRSFRSRLRNAGTEIRRPKSAGYESSGERSSSSTRKDRLLPGRHPFRRRVRLADSPRKGRLRTRISEATDSRFRFFPSQTPLTPKTGERKTTGPYPPAYRHEQRFSTDRQKQSRRTTVGSQRTKMAEQKSAWAAGRSVAANGYPVPHRSREGVTARNLDRLQAGARTRVR